MGYYIFGMNRVSVCNTLCKVLRLSINLLYAQSSSISTGKKLSLSCSWCGGGAHAWFSILIGFFCEGKAINMHLLRKMTGWKGESKVMNVSFISIHTWNSNIPFLCPITLYYISNTNDYTTTVPIHKHYILCRYFDTNSLPFLSFFDALRIWVHSTIDFGKAV